MSEISEELKRGYLWRSTMMDPATSFEMILITFYQNSYALAGSP